MRPTREFCQDVLGYRLYERIELDDGTETGAWMSVSIAAHELIYVADAYGARGRLHHLAFWVDTREECLRAADIFVDAGVPIEAAPSKHGVAQGFFLYGLEPGGNRIEVTTGGYFVYDPDREPVTWSAAERARGQYWGVKTVESFHTYGTPDVAHEKEAMETDEQAEPGGRPAGSRQRGRAGAQLADRPVRLPRRPVRVHELARGAGRLARDVRAVRPVAPHDRPLPRGAGRDPAALRPRRQHLRERRRRQGEAVRLPATRTAT